MYTKSVLFDPSIKDSQRETDKFDLLLLNTFIKDPNERGKNPSNEIYKWDKDVDRKKNKENAPERSVAWSGNEYTKSSTWKMKVKTAGER